MKVKCRIDGKTVIDDCNSQMPLSCLIRENFADGESVSYDCDGRNCMGCIVLVGGQGEKTEKTLALSCLLPVFRINDMDIWTPGGFLRTEGAADLTDAYKMLKICPCKNCYEAKTLIFSHVVDKIINYEKMVEEEGGDSKSRQKTDNDYVVNSDIGLSSCNCLAGSAVRKILDTAVKIRRNRLV